VREAMALARHHFTKKSVAIKQIKTADSKSKRLEKVSILIDLIIVSRVKFQVSNRTLFNLKLDA
jgi:hypothetical protein